MEINCGKVSTPCVQGPDVLPMPNPLEIRGRSLPSQVNLHTSLDSAPPKRIDEDRSTIPS